MIYANVDKNCFIFTYMPSMLKNTYYMPQNLTIVTKLFACNVYKETYSLRHCRTNSFIKKVKPTTKWYIFFF